MQNSFLAVKGRRAPKSSQPLSVRSRRQISMTASEERGNEIFLRRTNGQLTNMSHPTPSPNFPPMLLLLPDDFTKENAAEVQGDTGGLRLCCVEFYHYVPARAIMAELVQRLSNKAELPNQSPPNFFSNPQYREVCRAVWAIPDFDKQPPRREGRSKNG